MTPNGIDRDRYIDVGSQDRSGGDKIYIVRRLPVALVLVLDQEYISDVLTALANSYLRIQTTQVHWQHLPTGTVKPPQPDAEGDADAAGPEGSRPAGVAPGVGRTGRPPMGGGSMKPPAGSGSLRPPGQPGGAKPVIGDGAVPARRLARCPAWGRGLARWAASVPRAARRPHRGGGRPEPGRIVGVRDRLAVRAISPEGPRRRGQRGECDHQALIGSRPGRPRRAG